MASRTLRASRASCHVGGKDGALQAPEEEALALVRAAETATAKAAGDAPPGAEGGLAGTPVVGADPVAKRRKVSVPPEAIAFYFSHSDLMKESRGWSAARSFQKGRES